MRSAARAVGRADDTDEPGCENALARSIGENFFGRLAGRPCKPGTAMLVREQSRELGVASQLEHHRRNGARITASSASVASRTCATVTPGAVSSSVARPPGKPITASSVTTRSTGRTEVSGSEHCLTIFDWPFAVCCMATITRFAPETRSIAPPMPGTILPGDHPVGEMARAVDLQGAEHRHVEVPAADQAERHRAVERAGAGQRADRPSARVGQQRMVPCLPPAARRCRSGRSPTGSTRAFRPARSSRPASGCRCRG